MIFYLVPAADGKPAMLQPTQADANREARERGLKVRAPDMEHEVPIVKAELMAYINALMETKGAVQRVTPSDDASAAEPEVDLDQHTGRHALAEDGYENGPPDFTSTQVAAHVLPKTQKVRDVCFIISKMKADELGIIALEVIARGARLGGLA